MGTLNVRSFIRSNRLKHVLIYAGTFIFIYVILITSLATKKYDLKEGEIAKTNIKAQREIKDEVSTQARIQEAINTVAAQYTKKPEMKDEALGNINSLFLKTTQLKDTAGDDKEKLAKLKVDSPIALSDDDFKSLLGLTKDELKALQDGLIKTMSEIYDGSIEYNPEAAKEINDENIKMAQETVMLKFNSSNLPKTLRDLGIIIGNTQIKPNSFYDKEKTEELKKEVVSKVAPVMIKKDQIIVKEGEPVTTYQISILENIGLLNGNSKSEWYIYISLAVLIALVLFLQGFYLYTYRQTIFNDCGKVLLISLLNCISLVLARSLAIISPFLIPFACVPMLLTLLINYKISLTISMINCILISGAVQFNVEPTLLAIVNVVLGAVVLRKMQQRNDILYSCIYIAIVNVVMTFSVGLLLSNNLINVSINAGLALIASCISGVLTIGFLPFFESTFDIVTTIKLLELSNPNQPLLKRLLIEAPGTYHHSILVANLSEVAAEAIGGNSVMARVSSYYHDVGKIKRPYFFKENQLGNDNPHNKITPNLSALIITSHVKDGIELAKEYKVPKIIQDIIEQHHGTSLVKYFYVMAKNSSTAPEEVNEEDFRYPGPIPYTKESGIVMLADGIEAAVRSISEPNQAKIEEMVSSIIKARLNDGQLDNCDLTLKDLDKIKRAFLKTLSSIYHQRIEYPIDKWDNKQQ